MTGAETVSEKGSAAAPLQSRYRPIGELLQGHAERDPDKPFLVSIDQGGRSLTFGQLMGLCNRFGHFLSGTDLPPGSRIAVLSDNCLELLALYFAIQRHGFVFCTVSLDANAHHVNEMLNRLAPGLVLWHEDVELDGLRPESDWIRFGDCAGNDRARDGGLFEALNTCSDKDMPWFRSGRPESPCVMSFTSGTAAAPKGVIHSFGNYFRIAEQTIDMWKLSASDRMLEYRSFGWASSHMLCLQPALVTGATILFSRRFSQSRFFDWIRNFQPTMVIGVPTVINMLLGREMKPEDRTAMKSLRFMSSSTAPLMVEQHRRFEETYGVELLQLYGMSEGGVVAGNHIGERRIGSVGKPGLYQDLKILDPEGTELPRKAVGEIEIGGDQLGWGYLYEGGQIERLHGRRLKTGDLGYLDEDGYLYVTGRAKDVIIRGGINVSPLEIDNVLSGFSDIEDNATIGVADAVYGEEIVSFVKLRPGAQSTEQDLRTRCIRVLPKAKIPSQIIGVDAIPKNERGKVDRKALRELWEQIHSTS